MSLLPSQDYARLLRMEPEMVCVDQCALIARKLAPDYSAETTPEWPDYADDITEELLNRRAAILAPMQGLRVRTLLSHLALPENGDIEIVDWNCAQGFHTLGAIEVLIERLAIDRLKRLTLISPSELALECAQCAAALMVESCAINRICRPFPAEGKKLIPLLSFKHPVVIHLLPECISQPGADLSWLAGQIASPGHTHFIVSIQAADPFASFGNLEKLRNLLPGARMVAAVCDPSIGFTPDYRRVSLRGELWEFKSAERVTVPELERCADTVPPLSTSDLNTGHCLRRAGLPGSVAPFLDDISHNLSPSDRLFLSPALSPYSADICLIRPRRGMTLIRVVRSRPDSPIFATEVNRAVDELRDMRRHLALYLPGIDGRKTVRDNIRIAVLATNAAFDELPEMVLRSNAVLITPEALHTENGNSLFRNYVPIPASEQFSEPVAMEALRLLSPPFHRKLMGKPLSLDAGQLAAINNEEVEDVIGATGSGKTTVMLLRAIRLMAGGERKVMIVVPDATAIHSLRHKLRRIYADVDPARLHLCAFPDLMRLRMASRPLRVRKEEDVLMAAEQEAIYGNPFADTPSRLYDAIMIDDAHCLSPQETDLLKSRFLLPGGHTCRFSNPLTDLYRRPENNATGSIHLTQSYSPATKNLRGILSRIFSRLAPDLPHTAGENAPEWYSQIALPSSSPDALALALHNIIAASPRSSSDTMIVADDERLLRDITDALTGHFGYQCLTTFATNADIERRRRAVRNPAGAIALHEDSLRHRFDTRAEGLKLTTPHHLEGIEAPHLILLFRQTASPDYRALYRATTATTRHLTICVI